MKRTLLISFGIICGSIANAQFPIYHVSELAPATSSHVSTALGNDGRVVGYTSVPNQPNTGYVRSNGVYTTVPLLPGDVANDARGCNIAGSIVGTAGASGVGPRHAYEWKNGTVSALQGLSGADSLASDINDSDIVVGSSAVGGGSVPVEWINGTAQTLPGLTSSDVLLGGADAIDNAGDVTGYFNSAANFPNMRAFLSSGGTTTTLNPLAGYDSSRGFSVNSSKVVVGTSFNAATSASHATMWIGGTAIDIGALPGSNNNFQNAVGITSDGLVFGTSNGPGGSDPYPRGFVYSQGSGMVDLSTRLDASGTGITVVNCIASNESGQVLCVGLTPGGASEFILTPVPEPSTILALGSLGTLALVKRRRRRL